MTKDQLKAVGDLLEKAIQPPSMTSITGDEWKAIRSLHRLAIRFDGSRRAAVEEVGSCGRVICCNVDSEATGLLGRDVKLVVVYDTDVFND